MLTITLVGGDYCDEDDNGNHEDDDRDDDRDDGDDDDDDDFNLAIVIETLETVGPAIFLTILI